MEEIVDIISNEELTNIILGLTVNGKTIVEDRTAVDIKLIRYDFGGCSLMVYPKNHKKNDRCVMEIEVNDFGLRVRANNLPINYRVLNSKYSDELVNAFLSFAPNKLKYLQDSATYRRKQIWHNLNDLAEQNEGLILRKSITTDEENKNKVQILIEDLKGQMHYLHNRFFELKTQKDNNFVDVLETQSGE